MSRRKSVLPPGYRDRIREPNTNEALPFDIPRCETGRPRRVLAVLWIVAAVCLAVWLSSGFLSAWKAENAHYRTAGNRIVQESK